MTNDRNNGETKIRLERMESQIEVLKDDVQVLKEDVQVLKEDVRDLKEDVRDLKTSQKKGFDSIIDFLNQESQKSDRRLEILREDHRPQMSVLGEGIRANRDRLDDHEERIQRLEAS